MRPRPCRRQRTDNHERTGPGESHPLRTLPPQKITSWSQYYVSLRRAVPVLLLVRGAALNDPGVATRWEQLLAERRQGMSEFAHHLCEGGHLRADIDVDKGADVRWALNSPELWELFVLRSGWTPDAYGQWMAMVAADSLLELPTNTTPPCRKIHLVLSVGDSHLHGTAPDRH